jgi:hypothetical protein
MFTDHLIDGPSQIVPAIHAFTKRALKEKEGAVA